VNGWISALRGDPLAWLLDPDAPAARHLALRDVVGLAVDDPELLAAQGAAMDAPPIAPILASQHPDGWWEKPGPGYATKYRGTVWQVIFLDQLGADPGSPGVRRACEHVLAHTVAASGGFGASGQAGADAPPPSAVLHCLNGNLVRALVGFGWLADPRLQRAIDWEVDSILGRLDRWYRSGTSGPGFACAVNEGLPCAWGAVKAVLGLVRIAPEARTGQVTAALDVGARFLLSTDPAEARYPMGWGNARPNGSWFRPGFPSGYVADVLQVLEAVTELGLGADPRLAPAVEWLLRRQDAAGRWRNENAYTGKTWGEIDMQGAPSRYVTIRACRVLRAIAAAGGSPPRP
jgi:hypothetical protein